MSEILSLRLFLPDDPGGKIPMHPEDYAALLEWVREKERWERRRGW
jgi:hypothetical protein